MDRSTAIIGMLTDERLQYILQDVREGAPLRLAALANGISEPAVDNLLINGLQDAADGHNSVVAKFALDLNRIYVDEIKWCRQRVRETEGGHKGAQWTLERVYHRYFGSNAEVKELHERLDKVEQNVQEKEHAKTNS